MAKQSPDCLSCFIYHFISMNVIMSFLWCIHKHVWYNKQSYYAIFVLHNYPLAFITQMNKKMLKKYLWFNMSIQRVGVWTDIRAYSPLKKICNYNLSNKSVAINKNTWFSYINDFDGPCKTDFIYFLIFIHI